MATITLYYMPYHNTKIITMPFCEVVKDSTRGWTQSATSSPPLIHIKIPFPFNDVEYKWTTCKRKWNQPLPPGSLFTSVVGQSLTFCGKHCLDFSFVFFQLPPCLKKPVFSKRDLLAVEGTSQAVLGSSDQRKVPAKPVTVSKKWKKSQLSPCVGK
jgi:hypothetical protein